MVTIICLTGRRSSGKTKTLKKFFGVREDDRIRNNEYIDKKNGKIVCAVVSVLRRNWKDSANLKM